MRKHLIYSFRQIFSDGLCIFGAVDGKNHLAMAEEVLSNFKTVIISKPGTFKKNNPPALFALFTKLRDEMGTDQKIYLEEDASKALKLAEKLTRKDEPVLCCGSFYLAGEIKQELCL